MKSNKRIGSLVSAVALMGVGMLGSVAPASAQNIFASPTAAAAAGVHPTVNPNGTRSYATDVPYDTTGGTGTAPADPYSAIFSQIQTATSGLLAGPGALSFGILILGLGFGVAWRLVTKGVKSVAK